MNLLLCRAILLMVSVLGIQPLAVAYPEPQPTLVDAKDPAMVRRFAFREPSPVIYEVLLPTVARLDAQPVEWLEARNPRQPKQRLEVGRRVLLHLKPGMPLSRVIEDRPLQHVRTFASQLFILEAATVPIALAQAETLATLDGVLLCHPIRRFEKTLLGSYAPPPLDPYFPRQWNLENRDSSTGSRLGADLNARSAWPVARGEDVVVAVVDDGVDLDHPDLSGRGVATLHYDFENGVVNGRPSGLRQVHGTAVAGLIAAEANNGKGISGVAPGASLASWIIFGRDDFLVSELALADMFQHASNRVSVQNHSWGNDGIEQLLPTFIEEVAISNALAYGRQGLGVVMVRAAGNGRDGSAGANDDGYNVNPLVIPVGAVRADGRVASYSAPGANVMVAAPSGDEDAGFANLFTTDRVGSAGYNTSVSPTNDLADYAFDSHGFSGTSGATPQISGLAALVLSVNTNLAIRDVQQVLQLSSIHWDLADPDAITNGAGFRFSHNLGFGVPDAGRAVRLARSWTSRPPVVVVRQLATNVLAVPDAGLRVRITGNNVPTNLVSIPAVGSTGLHPDSPTGVLPLQDVGMALEPLTVSLKQQAAIVKRGTNFFSDKIDHAARAGASFVMVYNNRDTDALVLMGGCDFVTVPAVFIGQVQGEALTNALATNTSLRAQVTLDAATYAFSITNTLQCEYVQVRLDADHPRRGDLRVTLVSPSGTRSVLQRSGGDDTPGPENWTYLSRLHYGETTAGVWTVYISDQQPGRLGEVQEVELILGGIPIEDTDADGLPDGWERTSFNTLAFGPADDPDGDGLSNAAEQIVGTDPSLPQPAFETDLSAWSPSLARLSWPGSTSRHYELFGSDQPDKLGNLITNVTGTFPETEVFQKFSDVQQRYYRVRAIEAVSGASASAPR